MNTTDIVLIGFDLDIIDLIWSSPAYNLIGYIDPIEVGMKVGLKDLKYFGDDSSWASVLRDFPTVKAVFGMDDPKTRKKIIRKYPSQDSFFIHSPSTHISPVATIKSNCILQHNVTIMPHVSVGEGCLFHTNSTVHHESIIGNYSVIASGAIILGRASIGDEVYIGAGAIIKQEVRIGKGTTIGAGAVVINDIPEGVVVVGNPANRYLVR